MMGRQADYQHKLFMTGFNLEKRIRNDHALRKTMEKINFDFVYKEVNGTCGCKGMSRSRLLSFSR